MKHSDWKVYRTRFLVRAKQLAEPLYFVDVLGREHHGNTGDYLIEFSDGIRRIVPCVFFEDVYVPVEGAHEECPLICRRDWPTPETRRTLASRRALVT